MRKKIINLPRGYLSVSQVSLWLSSPDRYKALYFDCDETKRFSNSGLDFGKVFATNLENETETGDLLTDVAMELLPKYDVRDKEINTVLKTKDGEIPLVGRPDMLDSQTKNFREIKTGKIPWTQKKADKHLQLKFYAMIIYLEYGVLVKDTWLDWVETYHDGTKIVPSGKIESFNVVITMNDILDTMALTSKVAKEIEVAWSLHVPKPELIF